MEKEDLGKIDYNNLKGFLSQTITDVFIQLSDSKFVKIIGTKSIDPLSILTKYKEKGVSYFFIKKEFIQPIREKLYEDLENSIDIMKNAEESQTRRLGASQKAIGELRHLVKSLGVDGDIAAEINDTVDGVYEIANSFPALEAMLEVISGKGEYIQKHGLLTSFVCCSVAERFSWCSNELKKCYVLASLFQDISLDSDRLASIYDKESDAFHELDEAQKEVVINHVTYSSVLLDDIKEVGEEASRLVKNHHEKPSGDGFLKRLNHGSTGPIDACFIVSVRFAHELIQKEPLSNETIREIAQAMNEIYNMGNFKNIYKNFLEVFSKLEYQ